MTRDRRPEIGSALALATAIACAAAAQAFLPGPFGLVLAALSIGLAALASRSFVEEVMAPPAPSLRPVRPGWIAIGLAALVAALLLQSAGLAPVAQLASWSLSVAAWSAAFHTPERDPAPRSVALALVAISLLACTWRLDRIPGGFHGDEAELGLHVVALIGRWDTPPFATGWSDGPTLFTWIEAACAAVFGGDIGGLRVAAALGGALVVLPWLGLLRRGLALGSAACGALVLALSPAHLHLSRLAQSESLVVLFAVAALGALFAALRTGRAASYVHAGTWMALCFYMGSKAVLAPPIFAGALAGFTLASGRHALRQWRGLALTAATAALVFAPQLADYARHGWWKPLAGHPARWAHGPLAGAVLDHVARIARLLIDGAEESSFSPFAGANRAVTSAESMLFLVGLGVCLGRPRRALPAFLLGWLAAGLLSLYPDTFPNQLPHMLLIAPLPSAFGAVALHAVAVAVSRVTGRLRSGTAVAWSLAVAASASSASAYLVAGRPWAHAELTQVALAMRALGPGHHLVLVTPPMSWDANPTLQLLAPGVRAEEKLLDLDPTLRWLDPPDVLDRDVAFVVHGFLAHRVAAVRARYPRARVEERRGGAGEVSAAVIVVPVSDVRGAEPTFPAAALR